MLTQIRLFRQEQSDQDQHCFSKRLLKHFRTRQTQMTFVVIGALRVKQIIIFCDNFLEFQRRLGILCESSASSQKFKFCLVSSSSSKFENVLCDFPGLNTGPFPIQK